jgi:S1-C subfamily serine protease
MARSKILCLALLAFGAIAAPRREAAAETVLLDFTSEHCPPCRAMDPILRQMAAERYHVRQVDAARDPEAFRQFRVDSTPTFIVLVDGQEWARLSGATSRATLIEMMHKATALARGNQPTASGPGGAGVAAVDFEAPMAGAAGTSAPGQPREGRVVPIQDPFASRAPARTVAPPTDPGSATPGGAGDSSQRLIAATVRLKVTDPGGRSTGTGVVVDARNGAALVLTCGHIFRESNGGGPIEISLFTAGPNGAELRATVAGELIDFDLERDLALVRFDAADPVAVTPIAPLGTQLEPGAPATSVGCSNGENPTAWPTRITALNRFQTGHPNVEAARAPVEGRSGGPLFNAAGQVIGICFASDHEGDEGLYASLPAIHAKLDELSLAMVYQAPATGVVDPAAAPANAVVADPAAAPAPTADAMAPPEEQFAVRGQNPSPAGPTSAPGGWPTQAEPTVDAAALDAAVAGLTPEDRAGLEEIALRGAGSEVICIIRPESADGRSQVIKLNGMSPAFVQALAAASAASDGAAAPPPAAAATAPGGYLR